MPRSTDTEQPGAIIRVGRLLQMSWGIALVVSLLTSLNAFILVGWLVSSTGGQVSLAYIASVVVFAPMVLTFAERAMSVRGVARIGIFDLIRASGSNLRTMAGGWLLLMGYVSLAALLARGAGFYLSILTQYWFTPSFDTRWLALGVFGVALLVTIAGITNSDSLYPIGPVTGRLVYAGLVLVLIVAGWAWLDPAPAKALGPTQQIGFWGIVALLVPRLWGIGLLLGLRRQMRQPRRRWVPALAAPIVLGGLLGAIVAAVPGYPHLWVSKLGEPATLLGNLGSAWLELAFVITGLFLTYVALHGTLDRCLNLVTSMTAHGYLPGGAKGDQEERDGPRATWILTGVACILIVGLVPIEIVVGLVSAGFLWVNILLNGPELFRRQPYGPSKGVLALPFHPLFPGLAVAVGIFLSVALPLAATGIGIAWLAAGAVLFLVFGRKKSLALGPAQDTVSGSHIPSPAGSSVVAAITDPYSATALLQAAARLARVQNRSLIALQVLALPDYLPSNMKQLEAQQQLAIVQEYVERVGVADDIPIVPFVRVAPNVAAGIVDTVREEDVELLVLSWETTKRPQVLDRAWETLTGKQRKEQSAEAGQGHPELDETLDSVIHDVRCDTVVLRGRLPDRIDHVLVPTSGGSHNATALMLGKTLAQESHGQVTALHVVVDPSPTSATPDRPGYSPDNDQDHWLLAHIRDPEGVEPRVVHAPSIDEAVLRESLQADVLVLSATKPTLLEHGFFEGLPTDIAHASQQPTILVRPSQETAGYGPLHLWLRDAWQALSHLFSTLAPADRAAVSAQMRIAAHPSINFFVLITLAATIATLGLLQDSAAVIIGAMLVAPLMSPIAAVAMGIAEGDAHLMRVSAEAALKGIVVAIVVGMVITLISPDPQGAGQILGRTQPNLLDLGVALASGAAAGYALSRKEVSAALPGVSISVALVPPLCVVGFGLATTQFDVAGGAFLLFVTNVIAIILAAAVVFLLQGFRPASQQRGLLQKGLLVSIVSLVLIAVPLALLLEISIGPLGRLRQETRYQEQITTVLDEQIPAHIARVADVALERTKDGYIVHATLYDFEGFRPDQIDRLQALLTDHTGLPLTLQVTLLQAVLTGGDSLMPATPTPAP